MNCIIISAFVANIFFNDVSKDRMVYEIDCQEQQNKTYFVIREKINNKYEMIEIKKGLK